MALPEEVLPVAGWRRRRFNSGCCRCCCCVCVCFVGIIPKNRHINNQTTTEWNALSLKGKREHNYRQTANGCSPLPELNFKHTNTAQSNLPLLQISTKVTVSDHYPLFPFFFSFLPSNHTLNHPGGTAKCHLPAAKTAKWDVQQVNHHKH